jgi:hypothetical protein
MTFTELIMEETILIQLTNKKAAKLIHDLEELNLIKILKENINGAPIKLSDKYRGVFSKEDAKSFNEHAQTLPKE